MPFSQIVPIFRAPAHTDLEQLVTSSPAHWPQPRILKKDKGTTVTFVQTPTGAVVIKHHRLLTWRRWVDAWVHGSPAQRAWQGAQLLRQQGFPIPQPLGVFERRVMGFVKESWYCSEALLTQPPLDLYWQHRCEQWQFRQRRLFLRSLAEFLRAFHAAGLYAGDMRDANLLVKEHDLTRWEFYLVDLDRVLRVVPLSQQRRLKNLVQLERTLGCRLHAGDRLFFLHCYLDRPLPSLADRKQLIRQLLQLRNRKDQEYARRRQKQRRRQMKKGPSPDDRSRASRALESGVVSPRAPISCCIICFNEEANIRRCLESVKWCDEIVVIDSFSTDHTVEICREYTTRILQRPWPGYVEQKRFALAQTTHEWVLNVDADEEVSAALREEILFVLQRNDPAVDGFSIPRLVCYLGRWWRRGWYPGRRLRLFRKAKVRWGGVDPHEKVLLRGHEDRLHGDLYHYTYKNISDHLRAVNGLTDVAVHEQVLRGNRTSLTDFLLRPLWRFLRFYFLRGTFTYGIPGFFVSVTSAFYVFLKYAKLWEQTVPKGQSSTQDSPRRSGTGLGRWRSTGRELNNAPPQVWSLFRRRG